MKTRRIKKVASIAPRFPTVGRPGCRVCGGTGWELVTLRRASLARRCRCRAETTARFWTQTVGIPARYGRSEWKDYLAEGALPRRTRQAISAFLRPSGDGPGTLFLVDVRRGRAGEVAAALLKEAFRVRKRKLLYIDCRVVSEDPAENLFNGQLEPEVHRQATEADLLVLEHLFVADLDEAVQRSWIDLLQDRYLERRRTILPLDFWSLRQIRAALRGNEGGRLAEAPLHIMKRVASDAAWCALGGERDRRQYANPFRRQGAVA